MDSKKKERIINICRFIIEFAVTIALAVFVAWCFEYKVSASGLSMQPTIMNGDTLLLSKVSYIFSDPDRFDVVYIRFDDGKSSIKRIVGLPGETVQIVDGNVLIDGTVQKLPKDMASYSVSGIAEKSVRLAEGEYFVLGDNGDASEDSRFSAIGNINAEQIEGKVWLRISPISSFGVIN